MDLAYLCLGKIGDVLSALLITQARYRSVQKPVNFVISKQYSALLDGIPWIKAHIYPGEWDDLRGAIKWAKTKFKRVIPLQTFGKDLPIQHRMPGFQLDQRLRSGMGSIPDILELPRTGNVLAAKYLTKQKNILVADQSESSKFPHSEDLFKIIAEHFPDYTVVRLSEIKLDRFRDFLALYDAADLIITVDTAHLHLSAATTTPVIALATDQPQKWHGSSDSGRFAFYCRYSEYLDRKPEFIHMAKLALQKKARPSLTSISTTHSFSYNPSQIRFGDKLFTSYRFHPDPEKWRTELAITDGVKTWPVILPDQFRDMSHEDMRLFLFEGKLHASYTVSQYGALPPIPCIVGYGKLEFTDGNCQVVDHSQLRYGRNSFDGQEKNWLFFEHGTNLHCLYQTGPEQIVLQLNAGQITQEFKTKTPACPFGFPRGGTQPVPYQGMWLRFCHSQSVNKPDRGQWLYHVVAVLMESAPPFQIVSVSTAPILSGCEHPYMSRHRFWKPRIVFPAGVIQNGSGWDVALGINDSLCVTAHIRPEDLNL